MKRLFTLLFFCHFPFFAQAALPLSASLFYMHFARCFASSISGIALASACANALSIELNRSRSHTLALLRSLVCVDMLLHSLARTHRQAWTVTHTRLCLLPLFVRISLIDCEPLFDIEISLSLSHTLPLPLLCILSTAQLLSNCCA